VAAQALAYGAFLHRLGIDAKPVLGQFSDSQAIAHLNEVLDSPGFVQAVDEYEREGKDPAIYFFEDFLRACDPANARKRGVHYSPPEVVSYIVRSADAILRMHFSKSLDDAIVLDPCCGVGTFLRHIEQRTDFQPQKTGFELMPLPWIIASCLLDDCDIQEINGLSDIEIETGERTLVILGNPPYSGHSSNAGAIADLLANYREGLTERNPKWLQDDYVKFIRMAQHRIETAGRGVVAFITNHSYLFNSTFRAMRGSLMRTFDEISILDLHGNVKRLQLSDENIFPIQMGVAISLFIKTSDSPECRVRYAGLQGNRSEKLSYLEQMNYSNTPWVDVPTEKPFFTFIPHDSDLRDEFYDFSSLFDIFGESSIGFVTSRDAFAIGFTREDVLERIYKLRAGKISDEELRRSYGVGDLDIASTRRELREDPNWQDKIIEVLYRPFDHRWCYYSRTIMERPRLPFMENLMQENIALAIGRAGQVTGSKEWDVIFCTNRPADLNLFRRGGAMLFPRYVYEGSTRRSNIKIGIPDPDALFYYIYALLHSAAYRKRYAELLDIDYPRIPIPADISELAALGEELISIHLMREFNPTQSDSNASIQIGGYEIPAKYIKDHKSQGDNVLPRIKLAVMRTIEISKRIDEAIELKPPWIKAP